MDTVKSAWHNSGLGNSQNHQTGLPVFYANEILHVYEKRTSFTYIFIAGTEQHCMNAKIKLLRLNLHK